MISYASYEWVKEKLKEIWNKIDKLDIATTVSDVTTLPCPTSALGGLSVSVISIGNQFNFFGSGHLNNAVSLNNGTTYKLLDASQFEPLKSYVGDPTATTMWITSGTTAYSLPLFFDSSGVYFTPHQQITGIGSNSTFSFTQLLILAEDD